MLKGKIFLLIICMAALCLTASPAMADLFHFTVHRLDMTYKGTTFDASLDSLGAMALTRNVAPIGTTLFVPGTSGDFNIWTNITNIVTISGIQFADGAGTFTLTDTDGDTITGDVAGKWNNMLGIPIFGGTLSNVNWNQDPGDPDETDNLFNGDSDSVSMDFGAGAPQPWSGTLIELTASGTPWFVDNVSWGGTITGGSVDSLVVPVPTAVILGVLGLGAVGLKLRKYA